MAQTGAAPVKVESRTCFGLEWYATEEDAEARGREVRDAGQKYNGGFFDGTPCGRAPGFDYVENGVRVYAVTVA